MRSSIRDSEPATSCLRRNIYHLDVHLLIFDAVRLFQDHPKFQSGLKECHLVDMVQKEGYCCGDIVAQVRMALQELSATGFVRFINNRYRTLGPFASLALAHTPRNFSITWDQLSELQKISATSLSSSSM